jgi:DNA-binding response OmpR family regulator
MHEKILVIDDEPLILMTIERALGKLGYDLTTTSDPDSFLRALSGGGADLLIMDLQLGGENSSSLVEKAVEVSPKSKVLIISGSIAGLPDRQFLQKPFRIEDLRRRVREILDGA